MSFTELDCTDLNESLNLEFPLMLVAQMDPDFPRYETIVPGMVIPIPDVPATAAESYSKTSMYLAKDAMAKVNIEYSSMLSSMSTVVRHDVLKADPHATVATLHERDAKTALVCALSLLKKAEGFGDAVGLYEQQCEKYQQRLCEQRETIKDNETRIGRLLKEKTGGWEEAANGAVRLEKKLAAQEAKLERIVKKIGRMVPMAGASGTDPFEAIDQALVEIKKRLKEEKTPLTGSGDVEKERENLRNELDMARDDISCMRKDREKDKEEMERLKAQLTKIRSEKSDEKAAKKKNKSKT